MHIESEVHLGVVSWVARGPLFVNSWWRPPTANALQQLADAQIAAWKSHGKLGVVTILGMRVIAFLDEPTRAAAVATRDRLAPTFLSDAYLVPDSGFVAAAIRSVLIGVNAMTRSRVPQRVFSDAAGAADFTADRLAAAGHDIGSDLVLETISHVRGAAP